ncbi:MAG: hypothetical protein OXT65_08790 [Alphaproteobacteria bacterium]|nr:hypothetical protein [Alphaproteobacteria bacterium]
MRIGILTVMVVVFAMGGAAFAQNNTGFSPDGAYHGRIGGPQKPVQPAAPVPQVQEQQPVTATPVVPVVTAAPVSTPAEEEAPEDQCAAFMGHMDVYTACQDRMMKIQRMRSAQDRRRPKKVPPPVATEAATVEKKQHVEEPAAQMSKESVEKMEAGVKEEKTNEMKDKKDNTPRGTLPFVPATAG